MRFEKCGNENGQIIMLIHGMATTGHACFDRRISDSLFNTHIYNAYGMKLDLLRERN